VLEDLYAKLFVCFHFSSSRPAFEGSPIALLQASQYLSMIIAPSTLKYAVCVATLPSFTQNFIFLSFDSIVKGSTDRKVFNPFMPSCLLSLD